MSTTNYTMTRAEVLAKLRTEIGDERYLEENCPVPEMARDAKARRYAYERAIELVERLGVA